MAQAAAGGGGGGEGANGNAGNNERPEPDYIFEHDSLYLEYYTPDRFVYVEEESTSFEDVIDMNDHRRLYRSIMNRAGDAHNITITGIFDAPPSGIEWGTFNDRPIYHIEIRARSTSARNNGQLNIQYISINFRKIVDPLDAIQQHINTRGATMADFVGLFTTADGNVNYRKFMKYMYLRFRNNNAVFQETGVYVDTIQSAAERRDLRSFIQAVAEGILGAAPMDAQVEPYYDEVAPEPVGRDPLLNQNNNNNQGPQWFQNLVAGGGGGGAYVAPPDYTNILVGANRVLPANAVNAISYNAIAEGTQMVNFQGEAALKEPRYYTKNTFNQIVPYVHPHGAVVANTGYKMNPFTKARIEPGQVRQYTAHIAAQEQQGGRRRRRTVKRRLNKRRSATKKRKHSKKV